MGIKQFTHNSCTVCGDSISDPVCKKCYIKQTEILLYDLKLSSRKNEVILRKIETRFPHDNLNDTECILCRNDNVFLCRYCFSIILTNILRESKLNEEKIENFKYNHMYEENYLEIENISKVEKDF